MKSRFFLACSAFTASFLPLSAADPAWWSTHGVKNSSPASNLSPATIGQAKHMVAMALDELENRLPATAFQALEADVAAVVNLALPQTQADFDKQKATLVTGQLKALAKPFYDKLRTLDGAWVDLQMHQSGIRVLEPGSSNTYSPYPWSVATADDANKAIATVGQLKAVFSLPLESWFTPTAGSPALPTGSVDTDGDGLSDVTENALGTNPNAADTDGDGIPDGLEVAAGTNPASSDTDGDGLPDGSDPEPLIPDTVPMTTASTLHVWSPAE